jgi:hypothetical protein
VCWLLKIKRFYIYTVNTVSMKSKGVLKEVERGRSNRFCLIGEVEEAPSRRQY